VAAPLDVPLYPALPDDALPADVPADGVAPPLRPELEPLLAAGADDGAGAPPDACAVPDVSYVDAVVAACVCCGAAAAE
jgi:hypothetical protein